MWTTTHYLHVCKYTDTILMLNGQAGTHRLADSSRGRASLCITVFTYFCPVSKQTSKYTIGMKFIMKIYLKAPFLSREKCNCHFKWRLTFLVCLIHLLSEKKEKGWNSSLMSQRNKPRQEARISYLQVLINIYQGVRYKYMSISFCSTKR